MPLHTLLYTQNTNTNNNSGSSSNNNNNNNAQCAYNTHTHTFKHINTALSLPSRGGKIAEIVYPLFFITKGSPPMRPSKHPTLPQLNRSLMDNGHHLTSAHYWHTHTTKKNINITYCTRGIFGCFCCCCFVGWFGWCLMRWDVRKARALARSLLACRYDGGW